MIPRANVTAWRRTAPWPDNAQVEQDLGLSRALVELFQQPRIARELAFRGGTALHKLFFDPPGRYSEDIDLVQREASPIGPLINRVRETLDPWLGAPKWRAGRDNFVLSYRFDTSHAPVVTMRLKIEINTREHFAVDGYVCQELAIDNPWFSGAAEITTFTLSELLGTKLRALHQRRKGRDLFDLALGLEHAEADPERVVAAFESYMEHGGTPTTRAQLEASMSAKMTDRTFLSDIRPLLRPGLSYDAARAWSTVHAALVSRLRGDPWKGEAST